MRTTKEIKKGLLLVVLLCLNTVLFGQKYWVGGQGDWSDLSHWSYTSGGASGASVPTLSEDVIFDANSGFSDGETVNVSNISYAKTLDFSGLSNQIKLIGAESTSLIVSGRINTSVKFINEFKGSAAMTGTSSDYKYKKFDIGEFFGKQAFNDVYKNKIEGVKPLIVSSVDTTIVDATCGANGSITLSPNDGVGPFSYDWYPKPITGDGTASVTGLAPGRYTCVLYDLSDGLPFIVSDIQVDGPSPLTISLVPPIDSVDCNGGSDGELTVLVFGGIQPYTYTWDDPTAQANMTTLFIPPSSQRLSVPGLSAGTYSLNVTDDVGCSEDGPTWTVEEPTLLTTAITDTTHVFCFSDCTGDATVTPSGGTPGFTGYTYDWYDAPGTPSTPQAINLCQGTYHVEVTDGKGCLDTAEITITQPTELVASISSFTHVQCFGANDGTATAGVAGGTTPYTYDWYDRVPTATTPAVTNLAPGTYNVEVTDFSGCLDTAQVTITEPTLLTSSITDTVHVLCNGDATGEAEVTPVGGTSGYTYSWYDAAGTPTAQRLTNVIAGTYNVEVEDDNGCLDTSTVTITQPASVLSSSITDTTHNLCFGDCDGIAIVTPAGGTSGYTYDWYDAPGGITDSTINNLCAGTYNVEVTDGNGCLDTSVVTITEPTELTGTTTLTMVDCKSNCIGEIDLNPTGGVTTYNFDWYDVPGTPTSEDVTGLCAGTYNVEITDNNGCLDTVTATITEPDTLVASIISATNILCNGDLTGDAVVSQTGGVTTYNYSWYDAPSDPGTAIINNLPAGTYNVEVTDGNGCTDTTQVTLTQPALPLTSSITDTVHILCKNACTGVAEVTAAGGVLNYNYDWYDVPGTPTTDRITNLCDGTYHVEITDNNGCLDTSEVIIREPLDGVTISINDSSNANCNGVCDGLAFATYSGGTGTLVLDWYSAGNQTTDTAFNLCAGPHYVEVTDDNGCSDTDVVFIEEPAVMVVTINSATLPTCFGDCNGEMSVTPSGGTSPYLYSWYDATGTPTTPNAAGQCAGSYNVRVEDNNGCVDTTLVILSEPDSLEHTIDTQVNLPCKNECNGIAAMTPIGGTSPYTITWYDVPGAPTGDSLSTLCAGTWNFELRDNNGCLDTGTVTLTEPALELTSSITDTTHNLCFGECNGDATALGVGGTGLITYDWYNSPDGDTDPIAENLCAGTYNVELEDANGCLDTVEVIITEPTDMVLVGNVSFSSCGSVDTSSASVSVSGGISPYTYDWYDAGGETNDTITGLAAGTYHCEVTDANGCFDTVEVIISPPSPLVATIRADTVHVDCFGNCNGRAVVERSGGTPTYTQIWYDVPGTPTFQTGLNLCVGTYHVEVTDALGCKDTAEVEIREPTVLISDADSAEASCFGVCDGRAWVDYSGGTSPYDIDWLNGGNQTTDTINALCAGTYQVEITDANGCLDTSEVTVTAPIVVTSSITDTTNLTCYNDCDGQAIVTPSGGSLPYTYSWFNAPGLETDSTANNLCFGTYNVEVRDNNGCVDTSEVSITSTSPQLVGNMDSVLTLCVGSADGQAIIDASGGIAPLTLDWYDAGNQTTDTATGLIAGVYNVEVTDFLGCIDTFDVEVTEPDTLRAIISDTTHLVCFGDSNGVAISTPTGGNAPYTYNWFDAPTVSTDSTVTGLPAGTWQVEVTDANGCVDTGSVTITQPTVLVLGSDSIQATCTGICTGAAIVVPSGATAPYSYDWYDAGGVNNDTLNLVCAGLYNVEVTDNNGCIDTLEVEVTEPVTITATPVDSSAANCHNTNEGWAAITGVGGTAPYSFWWDDPLNQTNDTATALFGGVYRAAVTDLNGCSDTVSITVNAPDSILPNDSLVNVSCKDACDGFIRIAVSGGTRGAGYTHSWNTASTDTFLTALCPGTYVDTITDGIGCVDTFTFVITEPDSLYALFSDTTDVVCSYSSNGQAIVTPTGGTPIYTYDWYDVPGGDTDSVASGISPGTYHVEVTDANGCIDTGEIVISSPAPIVMTADSVESTCSGICNGIAIISTTGGTSPYTYDWYENGNIDNDSIYNLCADTFSVAVVDSNGCRDTADVIVTQPVTVTASIVDTNQTTCYLGADGWAVIAGAGGTAPYTYWWNDPLNQTNDTAVGLTPGTYRAAVTDFNGCSDTIDVVIEQPVAWSHTKDSTAASCYEVCDGIITITPGGGNGAPYTHTWSNGSSSPSIIGLCDGIYTDTISDALGCLDTISVEITQPDSLEAQPTLIQNVVCFGDSTGFVHGAGTGGTGPYSYEWGDPIFATGDTINMVADTIRMIITDANGCKDTNGIRITEPAELITSIVDTIHANCICNAEATVGVTGGVYPYTYLWNDLNVTTDSIADSLCTGSYFVETTDLNGCTDTAYVIIRDTSVFSISITDTTHVTCNSICNGGAIVTPILGSAPFTYAWTDPAATTDSTVTGLCAGVVNVTVTDSVGCIRFASVTIDQPDSLIGTPMFTSPLCFGDTNGVAWVDVTGGTGPYFHSWDTTSVGDTVYNIGVGFYTDTITDANGCMDTVTVAVTEPVLLQAMLDSANISCFGSMDGTVWSEPTGGTSPYTYEWNDPASATTDTVTGLDIGTYTAIVTDFNGCKDTDSVAITQPLPLASSITDTSHVACFCTGVASVTPTGGTAPYSYLWSNASTDSTASALCAGSYWVEVTDFNGCTDTSYVTIRDTSGFVTDIVDSIMNGCFGLCNGSALARAENGVQPYDFQWDDPALTNDSLVNGLCAGTYTVTITDLVGCTQIQSVTITAPDSIELSLLDTMVNCNGACDGSARAVLAGGTPPYYFDWLDPALDDSAYVDSLCAGDYIVEVLDDNGCFVTDTVTIAEPAELIAFISPFSHVSCFGESDASLTALPTGGTAPFDYSWSSGELTQTIAGKGPGLYTVTVTDTLGCVDDTSLTITEPTVLASSITDTTHILCGGTLTGSATVTPTGGTTPYTYDWFDAPGTPSDSVATNLPAGTYRVAVIDANGCSDTSTVTITEPAVFSTAITSSTTTSCTVCDGTAAVTPTGGVLPYTYDWYDAPGSITDSSATALCAAIYNVEVTDANGCIDTSQVVITGPGGLTAGVFDTTMVSCNGLSDGMAVATGVAGTAPYTYLWDDIATTANDTVANLPAGTFNVTVTDDAGCIATAIVTITEPDVLVASIADTNATGCASPCTGSATAGVTGGTGPYDYLWNDWAAQTTITASNICAGEYIVNVTDANGCTDTSVAIVTGPGGLTVSIDSVVNISCFGACDGNAAITPSGGVKPYDVIWNDPLFTADTVVTGLCGGIVNAQVTDDNGCLAFANVNIIEPTLLEVTIVDSTNVTCNLGSDGWAAANITGGTLPYVITWNDAAVTTNDTVTGLVAGTYTITVVDANGCSETASVTIEQPTAITVSTSGIVPVLCTGFCIGEATLTVSGGTIGSGYSYLWEDGQTSPAATGLCSGFQTYTVTDGVGCAFVDSVEIEDLNDFNVTITGTAASCSGDCDGTVLSTPTGGTLPYTHSWDNGSTSDAQSALCPGVYVDTVFDAGGCFIVDSFRVVDPSLMVVDIIDSTDVSCFGLCDGMAVANATGGTAPYTYTWYNAPVVQINDTVVGLCANDYYVRAEDAAGCTAEDTVVLSAPPRITVLLDASTPASCSDRCDATADVSATGGRGTLSIAWEDGDASLSRTALCPGEYVVYATDDSSCVDSVEFTISSPDTLFAIITDTTHLECSTVPSGAATVGEVGGTGPYTYNWYDAGGATGSVVTGLTADTFHVEVTDFNGCLDTAQVIINDDNALRANLIVTNISCNGLCDGKVVADVTGGAEPYVFNWVETGTSGDSIEGLCAGNYNLTVTDFNLCPSSAAGLVIEPSVLTSSVVDSSNLDCYEVCDGFATVSPSGGTGPYTYQWNDPTNQTAITATGLCAETYKVVVTDSRGCLDSSYTYLTQPDEITATISVSDASCSNTTDGSFDITSSGGTPGYTYTWTNDDGFSSTDEDPSGLAVGKYNVTILDANGCSVIDSATVGAIVTINAFAGNDTTICDADSITFNATGGSIYSWNDGGTSATHTVGPTSTTQYILTVFDSGCTDFDTVVVNVNDRPDISIFTDDDLILTGGSAQLIASGAGAGGTYDWEPPFGLNDPTIANPIVSGIQGTTYIVTGTDVNGCADTAMISINVATTIIFPDGITPNGDGLNETWVIQLIQEFPDAVVQIFNRWGQKVFESVGYQDEWDGTMNGKKLPVGTYYYVIDLGPDQEKYTGPITLMR